MLKKKKNSLKDRRVHKPVDERKNTGKNEQNKGTEEVIYEWGFAWQNTTDVLNC